MKKEQSKEKDGGSWTVQFIISFIIVFIVATTLANWDTIKEGYDKGKEQKQQEEQLE
ncbi:MAG: hypothetical protein ABS904_00340 [Solibacillus isronensis]